MQSLLTRVCTESHLVDLARRDEEAAARVNSALQPESQNSRPTGRQVTKAHLLVAGRDSPYREEQGMIVLEVPTINVHKVVGLDLAV